MSWAQYSKMSLLALVSFQGFEVLRAEAISAEAPEKSVYIVQSGDSLSKLAFPLLGHPRWRDFLQWNPSIKNPDLIFIGQTLFYESAEKQEDIDRARALEQSSNKAQLEESLRLVRESRSQEPNNVIYRFDEIRLLKKLQRKNEYKAQVQELIKLYPSIVDHPAFKKLEEETQP